MLLPGRTNTNRWSYADAWWSKYGKDMKKDEKASLLQSNFESETAKVNQLRHQLLNKASILSCLSILSSLTWTTRANSGSMMSRIFAFGDSNISSSMFRFACTCAWGNLNARVMLVERHDKMKSIKLIPKSWVSTESMTPYDSTLSSSQNDVSQAAIKSGRKLLFRQRSGHLGNQILEKLREQSAAICGISRTERLIHG